MAQCKGIALRLCRICTDGVIDEVFVKAGFDDLLGRQVAGELVEHGRDHLDVREFLGADVG